MYVFFPNSVSLGSSAIVKVPEQVGAAKSSPRKFESQVPRKGFPFPRFPGTVSQARFPGTCFSKQNKVPRTGFQASVSRKRFPGRGVQARFPASFPTKISRNMFFQANQGSQNRFSSKCFQTRCPGRGVQARFPASWFPSKVFRKRFPSKVPSHRFPGPKNRFTSKAPKHVPKQGSQEEVPKQGFQQQVPRNRFPNKFPKNRFTSKVPGKSSQAMFPGKGSQAKFSGTASQAQARFPGRGSQARVPSCFLEILLGNQLFLGTRSSWEPCSCEPCSCLEPCLETVPGTLLGNRFWEPYLQAVPKNLTLIGNLFLDTCLGASSWELAREHFSPTA